MDGNAEMLTKAFENARRNNCILNTVHADWRWLSREIEERFDAVICHMLNQLVLKKIIQR